MTTTLPRPTAPTVTPIGTPSRRPGQERNGVTFGNGPSCFAPLA